MSKQRTYCGNRRFPCLGVKIIVMRNAEIAQYGTPRELYEAPGDAFVADFIGEANLIDCEIRRINDGVAEVAIGNIALELAARDMPDLSVGAALIAVRPGRVVLSAVDDSNVLPAEISKATYVGSHMEYRLSTEFGDVFAVSTEVGECWRKGDTVGLSFAASGPVLLPK